VEKEKGINRLAATGGEDRDG